MYARGPSREAVSESRTVPRVVSFSTKDPLQFHISTSDVILESQDLLKLISFGGLQLGDSAEVVYEAPRREPPRPLGQRARKGQRVRETALCCTAPRTFVRDEKFLTFFPPSATGRRGH